MTDNELTQWMQDFASLKESEATRILHRIRSCDCEGVVEKFDDLLSYILSFEDSDEHEDNAIILILNRCRKELEAIRNYYGDTNED